MRYIVTPARKRDGNIKQVCESRAQAESKKKTMEVLTGKEWIIIEE